MDIYKSLRVRDRAVIQVKDEFHLARLTMVHSDELNQRLMAIFGKMPKNTPNWVKEYVRGYIAALRESLHQNDLEFCYTTPDGLILSTHRESPQYYEKYGYSPKEACDLADDVNGNFYWRGSDQVFF